MPYEEILWNVPSPRVLINDDGVGYVRVQTNQGINLDKIREAAENCK